MKYHRLHSWKVTPKEAGEIQLKLKPRVRLNNNFNKIERIAKPLFISPGNKINLTTSVEIVLKCTKEYRLPEPLRQAHLLVSAIKREYEGA